MFGHQWETKPDRIRHVGGAGAVRDRSARMFLFTNTQNPDAAAAAPRAATPVSRALEAAAQESGVSFDYLLQTAKRESSLDPAARARTSSATGLFQFVEQTWLGLVKSEGPRLGLGEAAAAIGETRDGRFTVEDPALRRQILDLRKDPDLSARLAGVLTTRNQAHLARAIGREPSAGELYIGHFLGAAGASALVRAVERDPSLSAPALFPEAAEANRSIFYTRAGEARTVGQVYAALVSRHADGVTVAAFPETGAEAGPDPLTGQVARNATWSGFQSGAPRRGLFDLYRSDAGAVSDQVRRDWQARPLAYPGAPQRDRVVATAPPGEAEPGAIGAPISLLPPERALGPARASAADAVGAPLDLLGFMRRRG
jgi:hypothetical protein